MSAEFVVWEQQDDGSEVGIDFGVPGPFGDLALGFRFGELDLRIAGAYHTEEPSIFVTLLAHWARSAEPSWVVYELSMVRLELVEATAGLVATDHSENGTFALCFRASTHSPRPTHFPLPRASGTKPEITS